jgi:hypothetical protein
LSFAKPLAAPPGFTTKRWNDIKLAPVRDGNVRAGSSEGQTNIMFSLGGGQIRSVSGRVKSIWERITSAFKVKPVKAVASGKKLADKKIDRICGFIRICFAQNKSANPVYSQWVFTYATGNDHDPGDHAFRDICRGWSDPTSDRGAGAHSDPTCHRRALSEVHRIRFCSAD